MSLNRQPNIADPDGFYQELIECQRELSDEQANYIGVPKKGPYKPDSYRY